MTTTDSAPAQVPGPADNAATAPSPPTGLPALVLGSIGVVFGDIGTSPLYAFREAVAAAGGAGERHIVLGILSLVLWALLIVVTLKYVVLLLRADNNGEGGTLALMALATKALGRSGAAQPTGVILVLGVIGAALFYGDAVITPAISVLSAVEGVKLIAPGLDPYVVPVTVVVLVALFAVQSRGTARVAQLFGPVMLVWFLVIGGLGAVAIAGSPGVLAALSPHHAARFVAEQPLAGLVTLGAVFLAVTGAEALYADLGHFGPKAIRTAWLSVAMPALMLNYLGQGALVIEDPAAIENPFYRLVPDAWLWPMVVLATLATVIASQAVISGAYSLSRQAVQLGLLPRLDFQHTSGVQAGQIYVPQINMLLLAGVLVLVLVFRTSSGLASAYGLAVSGTMIVTGLMVGLVMTHLWRWPPALIAVVLVPLMLVDAVFLIANLMKVSGGGWVTIAIAVVVVALMLTWRAGSRVLLQRTRAAEMPLVALLDDLKQAPPQTVPGTAIFLTSHPDRAPAALLHTLKHFRVLHRTLVLLSVRTADKPHVPIEQGVTIRPITPDVIVIELNFGFMDSPNIPRALGVCRKLGWRFDIMSTSFFLSRRSLKADKPSAMALWRTHLFITLANNAVDATEYFRIPKDRVVEVGTQVGI